MAKLKRLGKGLDALLGEDSAQAIANLQDETKRQNVPIHWLAPNQNQPRQLFDDEPLADLAESIKRHGVLQPLLVRPMPAGATQAAASVRYEIIAGERRWRAAQKANIHEIPIVITKLDDDHALQVGLVENLQRQDLNPIEEAVAYQRLMRQFHKTQDDVAQIVAKSRSHIANSLRLLTLSEPLLQLIHTKKLSPGHARLLVGLANAENVAQIFLTRNLTVRDAENLVRKLKTAPTTTAKQKKRKTGQNDTQALAQELTSLLGLRVHIDSKTTESGSLRILYNDLHQLDRIIAQLKRQQS